MEDVGGLCVARVVRLHAGADPDVLGGNLPSIVAGTPAAGARLWVQDVESAADSEVAERQRDHELSRPTDPRVGPGLRVVLLRYCDGPADLIVLGHRSILIEPDAFVNAILVAGSPVVIGDGAAADSLNDALRAVRNEPAPDWGLGDPGADAVFRHKFSLPIVEEEDGGITITAALGLVLSRCTGQGQVPIGGADPQQVYHLAVDEAATVAGYLEMVRAAIASPSGTAAAAVGLATTVRAGVITDEDVKAEPLLALPFLAPPHHMSIHIADDGDTTLSASCWFRRDAFDPEVVEWFSEMLAVAHRNLSDSPPDCLLGTVELFDEAGRRRLAVLGGLGRSFSAVPQTIHGTVRTAAERSPDAVAVCFEQEQLTYRTLDEHANRAAHALREVGIERGDRVGVCLDRSIDLVVILLAVLKAGAAYVPMNPAYPADRLLFTTRDAELSVVVTVSPDFPEVPGVRLLSPELLTAADQPSTPCAEDGGPDDAAYVIYTSGSTGRPKGVVVSHRNVASLLAATAEDFGLSETDVWTLFHSTAFDFSVWEIWGCLMTGGRLVIVPYWVARAPDEFAALLAKEQVTVLNQTPSAFGQLLVIDQDQRLSGSVRLVVFGGEPLDTRPLRFWFDRHPEWDCRLVNMFGITETTVHVTSQTLSRGDALAGSRSVGHPLPGWHLYVLDPVGRPVPPGVAGEIYVGGAGVADGYLNRPDLNEQRFLPDPFSPGRMYRSGDRGRLLPNGRLEHLGRLDNQVKLRGFRIELDEIRACLLDAPSVVAAAVVLRQPESDSVVARLDSYVVFQEGRGDPEEVRRHAARFLIEYMVPATVTVTSALPLTPNGKTDTARLPDPLAEAPVESIDNGEDTEATLKSAWEGVFGFRVGLDEDFFSLGGNSLLAVRLTLAMRSAGLPQVPIQMLYLNRTVRKLAAVLDKAGLGKEPA